MGRNHILLVGHAPIEIGKTWCHEQYESCGNHHSSRFATVNAFSNDASGHCVGNTKARKLMNKSTMSGSTSNNLRLIFDST